MESAHSSDLPAPRLLFEDYVAAEMTVAYVRRRHERLLILAAVELLPASFEAASDFTKTKMIADCEINVRRWQVPTKEGIAIYLKGRVEQEIQVPMPHPKGGSVEPIVSTGPLDDDPRWPGLVLENEPFWGDVPFWGSRPGGTRWHRHIAVTVPQLWKGLSKDQQAACSAWLREQLLVDVMSRPALWGSMHLRLPNPLFRSVARGMTPDGRQLVVRLTPYPGKLLDGLDVAFRDTRPGGCLISQAAVSQNLARLEASQRPSLFSLDVRCRYRGLMFSVRDQAFIDQIRFRMALSSRQRRIVAPARGKGHAPDQYSVSVASPAQEVQVGDIPAPRVALTRLLEDESEFRARKAGEEMGQHWFMNQQAAAREFVRSLVGRAHESVFIVDPYFNAWALTAFAVATQLEGLPTRILTSAEHLRTRSGDNRREHGEVMLAELQALEKQDPSLRIEVRVARGERAPIHDRFLMIDEPAIWQLGSSLMDFGTRGTTVFRLPYPQQVRVPIEDAWLAAEPLDAFVAARNTASIQSAPLCDRWLAVRSAARMLREAITHLWSTPSAR